LEMQTLLLQGLGERDQRVHAHHEPGEPRPQLHEEDEQGHHDDDDDDDDEDAERVLRHPVQESGLIQCPHQIPPFWGPTPVTSASWRPCAPFASTATAAAAPGTTCASTGCP